MDDERRRILEMLEQRKITSTEADELMEALRASAPPPHAPVRPTPRKDGEPDGLGLPVSFIVAAARWLAVAAASMAFALRWALRWWQGQRPFRRRYH